MLPFTVFLPLVIVIAGAYACLPDRVKGLETEIKLAPMRKKRDPVIWLTISFVGAIAVAYLWLILVWGK